jgi:hypothetical protein
MKNKIIKGLTIAALLGGVLIPILLYIDLKIENTVKDNFYQLEKKISALENRINKQDNFPDPENNKNTTPDEQPPATCEITDPPVGTPNLKFTHRKEIHGTSTTDFIFITVAPKDEPKKLCWAKLTRVTEGKWKQEIYVGQEETTDGKLFKINVYLVKDNYLSHLENISARFQSGMQPGMSFKIPDGMQPCSSIQVARINLK